MTETLTASEAGSRHAGLVRRARLLAWATVAWNVVEAVVAIATGRDAGSIALIGFGLDSTIEVASAAVIIWQFKGLSDAREARALKLIGASFFALSAFVAVQAAASLVSQDQPRSSTIGIGLAVLSLIVMPTLAVAKSRTGTALGSVTVSADSRQTWLCSGLSAVLLIGLGLNATVGWWWADPIAGLVIAGLALREGREAWNGDTCCD